MKMSMGQTGRRLLGLAVAGVALVTCGAAFAELGQPAPWEYKLQEAATPVMENITWFHNFLLVLITIITLFVLLLLVLVVVKFNAKANPVPSKTTHNTLIEVAWTLIPVLILVALVVPSFRLLFLELDVPKADLTVKVTGKQWYWSYAYPDNGKFEFDSLLAQDKQPRLLGVDNEMVVPVNKIVRIQTTGADVIHSFAVPAFGIKIDSVPGRLNETWFKATKLGMFYGQCSELCGKDHAFMPIAVRVVSDQDFVPGSRRRRRNLRPTRRTRSPRLARRQRSKPESLRASNGQGRRDRKVRQDCKAGFENGNDRSDTGSRRSRSRRPCACPSNRMAGATSIRPTTRTSARCTWCSRSSPASSAARCRS